MNTKANITRTFRFIWLLLAEDFWKPAKEYIRSNRAYRRIAIALIALILVTNGIMMFIGAAKPISPQSQYIKIVEYARDAQTTLQRAHTTSQFILDSISNDQYLPFYSQYTNSESFNSFLKKYQQLWIATAFKASAVLQRSNTTNISIAFYDATSNLHGWCAPEFSSPAFDTIFAEGTVLDRRSRLTQIDSDAFNLYYTSARKVISKQGYYVGYVVVKYRLAHQPSISNLSRHWIWDATQNITSSGDQYFFTPRAAHISVTSSPLIYIDTTERSVAAGSFFLRDPQRQQISIEDRFGALSLIAGICELLLVGMFFLLFRYIIECSRLHSLRRMLSITSFIVVIFLCLRLVLSLLDSPALVISSLPYFDSASGYQNVPPYALPAELFLSVGFAVLIFVFVRRAFFYVVQQPRASSNWFPLATFMTISMCSIAAYVLFQLVTEHLLESYPRSVLETSWHAEFGFGLWVSLVAIGILFLLVQYLLQTSLYYVFLNSSFHRSSIAVVLMFYAVPQIAVFVALSQIEWYATSWNAAIITMFSLSLLLSFLYHGGFIQSVKQITHRTLQVVLVAVAASVLLVLQLNEELLEERIAHAKQEIHSTQQHNTATYDIVLNDALARYTIFCADTNIKSQQQFQIQSLTFWRAFQQQHPESVVSFSIRDALSGAELYQIKSGELFLITKTVTSTDSLAGLEHSTLRFEAHLRDSTQLAKALTGKRTPIDLRATMLSSRARILIPSARLAQLLWKDSTTAKRQPTIFEIFPSGTVHQLPINESQNGSATNQYVTLTATISDSIHHNTSPLQEAAFVPYPRNNDSLHFIILLSEVFIILTFLGFVVALIFRVIEQRTIRLSISLQEKVLFIVFVTIITSYVFITQITSIVVGSSTSAASVESFENKKLMTLKELQTVLRFDSVPVIERHLSTLAEAMNCDITVFNSQKAVMASTAAEMFQYGLLPEVLPSSLIEQLARTGTNEVVALSNIQSTPIRVWIREIESPKQAGRMLTVMITQQIQSFTALQDRITTDVSDAITILALLALLLSSYLASRIVRPLKYLKEATQAVALGSLAVSLPRKRNDEIGEVVDAFNSMTQELSASRERVGQVEREGAWKEMARQVAHEIKNPLTPMKLSVQHVQHAFEHQDTNFPNIFRRVLRTLTEQIDVLTRIATEFARFGEMPRRRYAFVNLYTVVDSAVSLFESERSRIRFAIDIPKKISNIYADEEEFRRALVNLIKNAVQAIDGWGVILISANERSGLIHIRISDSGSGMKTDTLNKAFDPNFSTKTSGMGLGLAIVKKTIVDMSGTITVESQPDKGTTFHIELPARGEAS